MASVFTRATQRHSDSMVVSIWGIPKSGKTSFFLGNPGRGLSHWPLPLYVFNFDQGVDELLESADPAILDDVHIVDLVSKDPIMGDVEAIQLNKLFEAAVREAISDITARSDGTGPGTGTIVFDTASQYWQLAQNVYMANIKKTRADQEKKLMPFDYAIANSAYSNMIRQLKKSGANLVLVHSAQEVYTSGAEKTGAYKPQQNSQTDSLVQMRLQQWVLEHHTRVEGKLQVQREHGTTIEFCRQNDDLSGMSLNILDYNTLYSTIFGREPVPRVA